MNNGVYILQVISTDRDGESTIVTVMITVSHGKLEMITDLLAIPNPVSQKSLGDPQARVWIRYKVPSARLAGIRVKVYNVASELIREYTASDQTPPADPMGRSGSCSPCYGTFSWDGRNRNGTICASGLYVVVVEAYDFAGNIQRELVKIAIQ